MRLVLMGPPGVGKGTQAARLRGLLGGAHVSTGDILRQAVQEGSALGRKARGYMDSGTLVPDALMGEMIGERLRRDDTEAGFILDGFPRTVEQVAILDRVLAGLNIELDGVILLTAPEVEIVRRLSGRRVCPGCKAVYHLENRPPESAGVCDACGSALVQRRDDSEEVIRERLQVYRNETLPIVESYRSKSVLREVPADGDPDAVFARLKEELQ